MQLWRSSCSESGKKFSSSSCSCTNMSAKILIALTGLVLVCTVAGHCSSPASFKCRHFYNLSNISIDNLDDSKASCVYMSSSRHLICNGIPCNTAIAKGNGPIPIGHYRIEACRIHKKKIPWFNLHSHSVVGNIPIYWEYHNPSPAINCRKGLGLHFGAKSEGCITVTDHTCWELIVDYLTSFKPQKFETTLCNSCTQQKGNTAAFCDPRVPQHKLDRWCIGDLTVI